MIGTRQRFHYHEDGKTAFPDHAARSGQVVTVVEDMHADEKDGAMYLVKTDDGTLLGVYAHELTLEDA